MILFVLSYLNSASPSVVSTHWSLMILVKLSNVIELCTTSLQRTLKNWMFLKCGWKKEVFKCSLNLSWHLFLTRMFLVTKGKTRPLWQFTVHVFFCFVVFLLFFSFLFFMLRHFVSLKISGLELLIKERIFLCLGLLPVSVEMYHLVCLLTKTKRQNIGVSLRKHGLHIFKRAHQQFRTNKNVRGTPFAYRAVPEVLCRFTIELKWSLLYICCESAFKI